MGRGDATLTWNRNGHEVSLMARHSLRTGSRSHGALQLDYGFPISNLLRGHVQVFDGYGESLIDYNHKATYVGVGVPAGVVLMDVTIWHNPACSNSRGALKLIRDAGFDPEVIEYLGNPPDAATLRRCWPNPDWTRGRWCATRRRSSPNLAGGCGRGHAAGRDGRTPAADQPPRGAHAQGHTAVPAAGNGAGDPVTRTARAEPCPAAARVPPVNAAERGSALQNGLLPVGDALAAIHLGERRARLHRRGMRLQRRPGVAGPRHVARPAHQHHQHVVGHAGRGAQQVGAMCMQVRGHMLPGRFRRCRAIPRLASIFASPAISCG